MSTPRIALCAALALALGGCGDLSFGLLGRDGEIPEQNRKPANATEYDCDGGKVFYVRQLEGGAVWLIAPDREIRLERQAGADSNRYAVARTLLELDGDTAQLSDPPSSFTGCKRAGAAGGK